MGEAGNFGVTGDSEPLVCAFGVLIGESSAFRYSEVWWVCLGDTGDSAPLSWGLPSVCVGAFDFEITGDCGCEFCFGDPGFFGVLTGESRVFGDSEV